MSSDEKALELEVDEKLLGVIARSRQWGAAEERKRIFGLPCMEEEETDIEIKEVEENNQILGRNSLRRELKRRCKYCGTNYQDPTYCSVFGRSADKHKFI